MLKLGLFLLVAFAAGTQLKKSERLQQILKDNPDYLTNAPRPAPQVMAQNALSPKLQSTLMVNEVTAGLPDPPVAPEAKTAKPVVPKPRKREAPKPTNANAPSPAPRPTYAPQCEDYHNICNYHGIYSCCPGQKGLKARCDHKDCDPKRPLGTACGGEWMAVMCPKTCALCRVAPGGGPDGTGCANPPCPVQQPIAQPAQPAQPCQNAPVVPAVPAPAGGGCANSTAAGAAAGPNSAAVKLAEQIKAVARASVAAEQAREAAKTAKSAVEVVKQT